MEIQAYQSCLIPVNYAKMVMIFLYVIAPYYRSNLFNRISYILSNIPFKMVIEGNNTS